MGVLLTDKGEVHSTYGRTHSIFDQRMVSFFQAEEIWISVMWPLHLGSVILVWTRASISQMVELMWAVSFLLRVFDYVTWFQCLSKKVWNVVNGLFDNAQLLSKT